VWASRRVYDNAFAVGLLKLASVTVAYAVVLGLSASLLAAITLWWI
jgi:hypothetical protein